MAKPQVDEALLMQAVEAYYLKGGNKSEAARYLELPRKTYADRLRSAEKSLGIRLTKKVVDGKIKGRQIKEKKLPKKKTGVKRYILTSIQNNTHLHPGFQNLVAYAEWLDTLNGSSCELMIGTYSYQLAAYGPKATKRGTDKADEELWYDPEAEPYIVDESIQLAPGLVWCGEQNILPTAKHPLTQFEDYNGRKSNIVPHSKISMKSVAAMADEPVKLNYSTGTVTQRNYIQKKAGILAEQNHNYGGLLVEVDHSGSWWVRQLYIDDDDSIMDLGPAPSKGILINNGTISQESVVESIYWADVHAKEMDLWVRELCWGKNGMLDTHEANSQCMGDIFSMATRGHHEIRDFHRTYAKHVDGEEEVEEEIQLTADFLNEASRPWCKTVIVPANHDRHLDRWLNEADYRHDPINAKYFVKLQYQVLDAMDRGDRDFNILEHALVEAGANEEVYFLSLDESYVVKGIENGLHGDLGPNGSRGSTLGLTKLGRPINKGHDHSAAITGLVYSCGVCTLGGFSYTKGPHSHSISHILTMKNGARQLATMWANKWRA